MWSYSYSCNLMCKMCWLCIIIISLWLGLMSCAILCGCNVMVSHVIHNSFVRYCCYSVTLEELEGVVYLDTHFLRQFHFGKKVNSPLPLLLATTKLKYYLVNNCTSSRLLWCVNSFTDHLPQATVNQHTMKDEW
jgi:hypothetical protein